MLNLTDLQRDAMTEFLNIGVGRAVSALGQMVKGEIQLSVPFVELLSRSAASNRLKEQASDRITAVKQQFSGPFRGDALLLFPQEKSLELVHALLQETVPLEDLTELEREALMEVGNIILNACLGSIANLLHHEVNSALPAYYQGACEELLGTQTVRETENDVVLFLHMNFQVKHNNIDGYIAFLMDVDSVNAFKDHIDAYTRQLESTTT